MTETGLLAAWPTDQGLTPRDCVINALGDHGNDYDLDALVAAWVDAVGARLPSCVFLSRCGEVYGPLRTGLDMPQELATAIEDTPLEPLLAAHDLALRLSTLRGTRVKIEAAFTAEIIHARKCGMPVYRIAEAAEVSRSRVYQIIEQHIG